MHVYRLASKKYAKDLSGTGAAIYGGRWNKIGTNVLYTGGSKEIALLEALVHIPSGIIPALDMITLHIPNHSTQELKIEELPKNWADYPAPTILAHISQQWIDQGKFIALKVPSCIISTSFNYILNCHHKDYQKVKIVEQVEFKLDSRFRRTINI